MKSQIFTLLLVLIIGCQANAQDSSSPREQLKQYVAELQKSPDDQALREKIVKLAREIKPAPEIPREAREHEGAAEYIVKNAKSESDFAKAAAEYEQALLIAPWVATVYYNLGVVYEKSNQPARAIGNYDLYLVAAPQADDADAVIKKIGGLKFASKEAQRQRDDSAERERQKNAGQQLRSLVEGKQYRLFVCTPDGRTMGCNWEQYSRGKNWFTASESLNHWEFRGDAAYLVQSSNIETYRVRPQGPGINNLVWEFHSPMSDEWFLWQLFDSQPDFSTFIVGCCMRSKDEPSSNPNKVFAYYMYKAQ